MVALDDGSYEREGSTEIHWDTAMTRRGPNGTAWVECRSGPRCTTTIRMPGKPARAAKPRHFEVLVAYLEGDARLWNTVDAEAPSAEEAAAMEWGTVCHVAVVHGE